MRTGFVLGPALLLLGLGLVGCSNTAEGVKEDTAKNAQAASNAADQTAAATDKAVDNAAQATKQAAQNAGEATSQAAKNTAAALNVTPKVKDAIMADKTLNDTRNNIDVDSKDGIVHLKGHVASEEMKQQATTVAEKTLKDMNATDTVSNELTVKP
jgi:hyperosmotically inducible protein